MKAKNLASCLEPTKHVMNAVYPEISACWKQVLHTVN